MSSDPSVEELLAAASVPFGELIAGIGQGIAEAQEALDRATLDRVLALLDAEDAQATTLRALGWRPTWYHIPEAEANIQLTLAIEGSVERGARPKLRVAPINAGNTSRYGFDVQLASSLRFKIVPIPPPEGAEQLRRVPDLVGLDLTAASDALTDVELVAAPKGSGAQVLKQGPPAGSWLRAGSTVTIDFSD